MTKEEKAKAYDEALKQAKKFHTPDSNNSNLKAVLELIFPELNESKDERIRSCIKLALTDVNEQRFTDFGVTLKDCLAYIEKQKEQKPAEWSEEDEDKVDDICKLIEHATIIPRSGDDDTGLPPTRLNDKYKGELKAFVKSLRPHWKPSEKQMWALDVALENVYHQNDWAALDSLRTALQKLL